MPRHIVIVENKISVRIWKIYGAKVFDDWNSIMHRDFGMNHRNCKNHVYLYQDKVGSLHFHSSDHSVKNESSQQNRGFDEIATDSNNTFFFIGRFLKFCNKLRSVFRSEPIAYICNLRYIFSTSTRLFCLHRLH